MNNIAPKTKHFRKIALLLLIVLGIQKTFAQIDTTTVKHENERINLVEETKHKTVINKKMIDRFYALYNEIEVLDWNEMFADASLKDMKDYLVAYNMMDFENYDPKNTEQLFEEKLAEVRNLTNNGESILKTANNITMIDSTNNSNREVRYNQF